MIFSTHMEAYNNISSIPRGSDIFWPLQASHKCGAQASVQAKHKIKREAKKKKKRSPQSSSCGLCHTCSFSFPTSCPHRPTPNTVLRLAAVGTTWIVRECATVTIRSHVKEYTAQVRETRLSSIHHGQEVIIGISQACSHSLHF